MRKHKFIKTVQVLTAFALIQFSMHASALSKTGHRVVGKIAENHLSPEAIRGIRALIGQQSLAQISTWADDIRSDPKWKHTEDWHYVNIDPGQSYEDAVRTGDDIVTAMKNCESILRNRKATRDEKIVALKFLVHLVGDVHQPLHTGYASDQGGNAMKVRWFGRLTNLHRVWDYDLVNQEKLSFSEFAMFLDQVSAEQVETWQKSSYLDWVRESRALLPSLYDFGVQTKKDKDGVPDIRFNYADRMLPVIKACMQKAGVRLAGLLNDIFKDPERP